MGKGVSWYAHEKNENKTTHEKRENNTLWKVLKSWRAINFMVMGVYYSLREDFLALMGSTKVKIVPALCPLIIHQFIYSLSELHLQCALHRSEASTQLYVRTLIISLATPSSYSLQNTSSRPCCSLRMMLLPYFHPHQITHVHFLLQQSHCGFRLFVVWLKTWCWPESLCSQPYLKARAI